MFSLERGTPVGSYGGGGSYERGTPVEWRVALSSSNPCIPHPRPVNIKQGYLAHKKTLTPLGAPKDPRHGPTVGS